MIVINYAIFAPSLYKQIIPQPWINYFLTFLSAIGVYKILTLIIYSLINNNDFLSKLYWNKLYLKGIWSYSYTMDQKVYKGIWTISQDLFGIKIIGYGVDEQGKPRSDVQSVTQLIQYRNSFEIINTRKDRVNIEIENYSKTTLFFSARKRKFSLGFKYPLTMRANTIIYGGPLSGNIHNDVIFTKHPKAQNEEEVLKIIVSEY